MDLLEKVLIMLTFEIANFSQFKASRTSEIKRIKAKIQNIKKNLEESVFILEEKNLKYQDLLVQANAIEKKVKKMIFSVFYKKTKRSRSSPVRKKLEDFRISSEFFWINYKIVFILLLNKKSHF